MEFNMEKKLAVIGGGPAGLAAAIEACRNGVAPGRHTDNRARP